MKKILQSEISDSNNAVSSHWFRFIRDKLWHGVAPLPQAVDAMPRRLQSFRLPAVHAIG